MISQTISPSGFDFGLGYEYDYVISPVGPAQQSLGSLELLELDADQYATRDPLGVTPMQASLQDTITLSLNAVDQIFGGKLPVFTAHRLQFRLP
jgi:hypothetical protein